MLNTIFLWLKPWTLCGVAQRPWFFGRNRPPPYFPEHPAEHGIVFNVLVVRLRATSARQSASTRSRQDRFPQAESGERDADINKKKPCDNCYFSSSRKQLRRTAGWPECLIFSQTPARGRMWHHACWRRRREVT